MALVDWARIGYLGAMQKRDSVGRQVRRVRLLMNPRAGRGHPVDHLVRAVDEAWLASDTDVTFQFSHDAEDGRAKVRRAIEEGVDTILVAGGDGMVNTIGADVTAHN